MINLHYCGSVIESWSLYTDDAGCDGDACGDESEENDGCCKDEVVIVKVNEDQQTASQLVLKFTELSGTALPVYFTYNFAINKRLNTKALIGSPNAPPGLWEDIPLYKLHSSYTYYG